MHFIDAQEYYNAVTLIKYETACMSWQLFLYCMDSYMGEFLPCYASTMLFIYLKKIDMDQAHASFELDLIVIYL